MGIYSVGPISTEELDQLKLDYQGKLWTKADAWGVGGLGLIERLLAYIEELEDDRQRLRQQDGCCNQG